MKRGERRIFSLQRNLKNCLSVTSLPVPSIMHEFYEKKVTFFSGDEKRTARCFVDDIYLLFNQQRIQSAGVDTVRAWLDSLQPKDDALAALRSNCTDEQLIKFCKSRYIQTPSELMAWTDFLNKNIEQVVGDAEAVRLASEQAQQQQEKPDVAASGD